ncbi:gluconate 2-dehydrogenase subunit 3 family protein [Chitinophaga qingshengii]|uniref:Gluconate 2-dehydrogenase subunit 3 family protein n=1 Tax=Chitinophaga qingshengii TaxID=1569794 RepID=A0ABR7TGR1_9BACT|nr:gluconate 2-dehydrogenase subunit 3 family protein [Chitinophaga qingshengii]MBC9928795.1 gluconate 2-dehydrogenase subunit 3 family protein [Chitinophaga qingshengii]
MNRRKAITRIMLFGGAGAAIAGGVGYHHFNKTPDLRDLDQYLPLIAELAEVIIPETDTPGAKSAGVHDFIVTMIRDCSSRKVQNRFMYGLEDIASYARAQYGKSFVHCRMEDKAAIVGHFEKKSKPWGGLMGKVSSRLFGDSFFITLKKYTVMGYCTSMQGATKAMAYDYIPGRFQGCVPLQPGQRCWATE